MGEKEYAKGVEAYKNSLKANPDDDETRYNLAVAQHLLKKQQEQQNQDNQQQQQQQEQQEQQQQEQNQEQKMNKEQAEQILQALEQDEKDVQERRKVKMGQKAKVEKAW